jgi:hypothetical protein
MRVRPIGRGPAGRPERQRITGRDPPFFGVCLLARGILAPERKGRFE